MNGGIAKGVGEQLGELGSQIATEVAQVPAKITGMDQGGTNEATGQGTGGTQPGKTIQKLVKDGQQKIAAIARRDEADKQQKLAQARKLLEQFRQPQTPVPSIRERQELEELEKKKLEIEEEKKQVRTVLQPVSGKPKRGNLFGIKAKQFAGEVGKNAKAQ